MPESGSESRKAQILVEAREQFSRFGFRKCTLQDIADACGFTKQALYYYFKNKNEILAEVVREESSLLLTSINKAVEEAESPIQKLESFLLVRFEVIKELALLYPLTQSAGRELIPRAIELRQEFYDQEIKMLVKILDEGMKQGMFKPLSSCLMAHSLLAMLKGVEAIFFSADRKPEDTMQSMRELIHCFLHGLVCPQYEGQT
ncbi:MAG: TetR/AcrR family transcriptional regulator [Deltaproteobacteria bacterium]|nr:MAG: TetR/AcrR family transcriptional regulator [Deltaproteobacteria bacterium]